MRTHPVTATNTPTTPIVHNVLQFVSPGRKVVTRSRAIQTDACSIFSLKTKKMSKKMSSKKKVIRCQVTSSNQSRSSKQGHLATPRYSFKNCKNFEPDDNVRVLFLSPRQHHTSSYQSLTDSKNDQKKSDKKNRPWK